MNAPPLIRPLRSLLQRRLPLAIARPVNNVPGSGPSRQIRRNASVSDGPPGSPGSPEPRKDHLSPAKSADSTSPMTPIVRKSEQSASENGNLADYGVLPPPPGAAAAAAVDAVPEIPEKGGHSAPRMPRSVSALYLKPLRREAKYGVPSCDLQLRSYSLQNLEFFCDFALRAAYYLGLPAFGPVPLPRKVERWTVPKSNFIFKKSQENFERVTLRRLIQIRDGHPETVQIWLAFLQKHQYYGLGMKANVWEFSKLDVAKNMDASMKEVEKLLKNKWAHLAQPRHLRKTVEEVEDMLAREREKATYSG